MELGFRREFRVKGFGVSSDELWDEDAEVARASVQRGCDCGLPSLGLALCDLN